jgi:hypothetical protein
MENYRNLGYRVVSGAMVVLLFLIGAALLRGFVAGTVIPGSGAGSAPVLTNYWGFYMMGFAGAALWAWGACLVSAVMAPASARTIGTATAFGLVVNAIFRLIVWFSGEYAEIHNTPRVEVAVMLFLALAFIWLRPPRSAESGQAAGQERSAA